MSELISPALLSEWTRRFQINLFFVSVCFSSYQSASVIRRRVSSPGWRRDPAQSGAPATAQRPAQHPQMSGDGPPRSDVAATRRCRQASNRRTQTVQTEASETTLRRLISMFHNNSCVTVAVYKWVCVKVCSYYQPSLTVLQSNWIINKNIDISFHIKIILTEHLTFFIKPRQKQVFGGPTCFLSPETNQMFPS